MRKISCGSHLRILLAASTARGTDEFVLWNPSGLWSGTEPLPEEDASSFCLQRRGEVCPLSLTVYSKASVQVCALRTRKIQEVLCQRSVRTCKSTCPSLTWHWPLELKVSGSLSCRKSLGMGRPRFRFRPWSCMQSSCSFSAFIVHEAWTSLHVHAGSGAVHSSQL